MNDIRQFRDEYYFLSNFYPCPVTYEGLTYGNAEAAFQAAKCVHEADRKQFTGLSPSQARSLGRRIRLRKDWEEAKVSVMKEVVTAKFTQNPILQALLLATKDACLEEGNTWGDRTWGTVNGVGANLLGQILMELREEFQQEELVREDYDRD